MYHNLEWLQLLDVEYDCSTFDTDPFEPQPDGLGTIFPKWIAGSAGRSGYVELPYTLPQDMTLFVLLQHDDIHVWKDKLAWIADRGGMALLNTHPDYVCWDGDRLGVDEYPVRLYRELLLHVQERYGGQHWNALPRDVARFWRTAVVARGNGRDSSRTVTRVPGAARDCGQAPELGTCLPRARRTIVNGHAARIEGAMGVKPSRIAKG